MLLNGAKRLVWARGVAPVMASAVFLTATHTQSPDIRAGYAKNINARAVKAGLKRFLPVPPNTYFSSATI